MGWHTIFRQRPTPLGLVKCRTLFGFHLPNPITPFGSANMTQKYSEKRLLGYSPAEMYSIAVDVEKYREFVPWCIRSDMIKLDNPNMFQANMEIGFHLLKEQYKAIVTHQNPTFVKSVCTDGHLFNHLISEWKFLPGLEKQPRSCVLDFYVSFEFRSLLHAKVAHIFLDEVARQMVSSFLKRAEKVYGSSSMPSKRLS